VRSVSRLLCLTIVASASGLVSACAPRHAPEVGVATEDSIVDSLSANLVELELQRVVVVAGAMPASPTKASVDARIAEVHRRLRATSDPDAVERLANERALRALNARQESLGAELREMRMIYTDSHPDIRQAVAELRALTDRVAELRASGG